MIENHVVGGFEFDACFDSGNLGKIELSKIYNEGKYIRLVHTHTHICTACITNKFLYVVQNHNNKLIS